MKIHTFGVVNVYVSSLLSLIEALILCIPKLVPLADVKLSIRIEENSLNWLLKRTMSPVVPVFLLAQNTKLHPVWGVPGFPGVFMGGSSY